MAITSPGAVDYHLASQNSSRTLSLNPQSPLTFMAWISGVLSTTSTYSRVGAYTSATAGGTAVQIGSRNAAGRAAVWTWGAGVMVDTANAAGTGVLVNISDNVWTHYAYVFDGTLHNLYINGALVNTVNNSTGTSSTTGRTGYSSQIAGTITSVYINGYPTGTTAETGDFSCDDIRLFSRALSAAEILTCYTTAGNRHGIVYQDVAAFAMDGPIGSNLSGELDLTGGLNSLTPTGAATGVNFTYSAGIASSNTRPPL